MKNIYGWLSTVIVVVVFYLGLLLIIAMSIDALMFEMYGTCEPCLIMNDYWSKR